MGKRVRARGRNSGDVLKGLAAGFVGGLVASWVMEEFQAGWSKVPGSLEKSQKSSARKKEKAQGSGPEQEPATVKAAEAISENIFDHRLTKNEKKVAGPAVHYAMGAASGAIYGVTAELMPFVTLGSGLPFGATVWLIADDVAVPALGLSKPPTEYPLSTHAYALASHFVYGLTTDVVRRALRSVM
jgi:uncharacterized membrane protein YagU involved in acid resistance